jgi:hypothetical protein
MFPEPVEGTLCRRGEDVFAFSDSKWVRICSADEMSKHLEESGYWEELANKSC